MSLLSPEEIKLLRERSKAMIIKKCNDLFNAFPNMYVKDRIEFMKLWTENLIIYDAEIIGDVFDNWITGSRKIPNLPDVVIDVKNAINRKSQNNAMIESKKDDENAFINLNPESLQYQKHRLKDYEIPIALKKLNEAGIKDFTPIEQSPWKKAIKDLLNQKGSKMIHLDRDY